MARVHVLSSRRGLRSVQHLDEELRRRFRHFHRFYRRVELARAVTVRAAATNATVTATASAVAMTTASPGPGPRRRNIRTPRCLIPVSLQMLLIWKNLGDCCELTVAPASLMEYYREPMNLPHRKTQREAKSNGEPLISTWNNRPGDLQAPSRLLQINIIQFYSLCNSPHHLAGSSSPHKLDLPLASY